MRVMRRMGVGHMQDMSGVTDFSGFFRSKDLLSPFRGSALVKITVLTCFGANQNRLQILAYQLLFLFLKAEQAFLDLLNFIPY